LKASAKSSSESTTAVVISQVQNLSPDTQAKIPTLRSLQNTVREVRAASGSRSLLVSTRAALPPLQGTFLTPSKEEFNKWDSGCTNDRILIFSTDANLDTLRQCQHWFADGTFKSSPILFDQLFIIHGYKTDGVNVVCMPLVYVVTPNRITLTYKRVLEQLKALRPGLAPISIMTDFEAALLKAFSECFPNTDQRGCYYHFRQAIHRKIQSEYPTFPKTEIMALKYLC